MILLDTHVLVWWVSDPGKLSLRARRAIRAALRQGPIAASAISLFEIATLLRRGRLVFKDSAETWFSDLALLPEIHVEPVGAAIAKLAGSFEDSLPGDPADRLIAATALVLGVTLITADVRLRRAPRLQVIW